MANSGNKQGMMFSILIVEDEDRSLNNALKTLKKIAPEATITVARCRDEAIQTITSSEFDLIVCDLRIPTSANNLDADEVHGLAVHGAAQEHCPGTPLIFLSAYATPQNTKNQLATGGVADYYGLVQKPLVQLAIKDGSTEFADYVSAMVQSLGALEACAIEADGEKLDSLLARAVRTYGARIGAVSASVEAKSGLSGAQVATSTFTQANGQTRSVLIKLMSQEDSRQEVANYSANVPNKLQPGYFASSIEPATRAGLRKSVALYYNIASQHRSLFSLLVEDPGRAAAVVEQMARGHRAWTDELHYASMTVREFRRLRLSDEKFGAHLEQSETYLRVEEQVTELSMCTCHGDLHGENVLVDDGGRPTLIDYGDVGVASSAIDPITLELSVIYHKRGPASTGTWPAAKNLEQWADLEAYLDGCPYSDFIRSCRDWAHAVASDKTVYATAYAHSVRQLKYDDVPNERALAVAHAAANALLQLHR